MKLPLPIDEVLPQVVAALREHSALVLRAETGAGKTTRVPPALLDAGVAGEGQIVVLQPRRLAARAAATRIAFERGSPLGNEVGYQVRFDRRASAATRLLIVTEGVFVRRLRDDPFLEGVSIVVFDEFHERSLDADLALAMTRRVQREVRNDLKIVVMSATLEYGPVADYLGDCPVIESRGRLYPVEVRYLPHERPPALVESVVAGIGEMLEETAGDVLVFLPGLAEIHRARRALEARGRPDVTVMELYGDMPLERQQAVLSPIESRKIILATNVAETSLTIEGVTAVVDSGLARVLRIDPGLGINRLVTERISRASADQRAGRAGRTQRGVCLRLWTRRQHAALAERQVPEILRSDLAGPVLDLLCWDEPDVKAFPWFESPPTEHIDHALRLLVRLGAIGDRGPTPIGRQLVLAPIHPRLARLLLEGHRLGHPREAALAAAMLSERDPFRPSDIPPSSRPSHPLHQSRSDVVDRVSRLIDFEESRQHGSQAGSINPSAARFVLAARDQLVRIVLKEFGPPPRAEVPWQEAVMRGLFTAFFDRLARRRENDANRGVMLGGRGVRLAHESSVRHDQLFVCVDLQETGQSEALVRQASAVERSWLEASRTTTTVDLAFDSGRQRVVAHRRTRIEDLVLDEAPAAIPPDADPGAILTRELARELANRDDLLDETTSRLVARIEFLRQAMPELALPELSAHELRQMLPEVCMGCISLDDVKKRGFATAIRNRLSFEQKRALDQHAPERIEVPSGSEIAVAYADGQPPVLAVRIQEMFGLAETPKLAAGRVPVVLHLLGPNYRPQQVTSDLASFWRNGYPEVRKELRRRYPKHAWPDDPAHAAPERRPRPSPKR
jgi:ATP-dependent helicase HrpB